MNRNGQSLANQTVGSPATGGKRIGCPTIKKKKKDWKKRKHKERREGSERERKKKARKKGGAGKREQATRTGHQERFLGKKTT